LKKKYKNKQYFKNLNYLADYPNLLSYMYIFFINYFHLSGESGKIVRHTGNG